MNGVRVHGLLGVIWCTVVLVLLLIIMPVCARVGCMDNSQHLEGPDSKEYHYVACNCPCNQRGLQIAAQSRCLQCGHAHDPHTVVILGVDDVCGAGRCARLADTASAEFLYAYTQSTESVVAGLLKQYKKNK